MQMWEQVLLGIAALVLVLVFWPGARVAMEQSRKAQERDWAGVLLPVALVVLFVMVLIILARS